MTKKDEEILVIPTVEYTKQANQNIKDLINDHGIYILRSLAENDQNFLQIIPYIYLVKGMSIFLYQRLKAGSEDRLHAKYSIGVGGHVSKEDYLQSKWVTTELGGYRELHEELNISENDANIAFTNKTIYDPSNDVGKVHIGIIAKCELTNSSSVSVKETEKIKGTFTSLVKIQSMYDQLETWSQILLPQIEL